MFAYPLQAFSAKNFKKLNFTLSTTNVELIHYCVKIIHYALCCHFSVILKFWAQYSFFIWDSKFYESSSICRTEFLIHCVHNSNKVLGKILANSTLTFYLIPCSQKAMCYSELLVVLLGAPLDRSSTHSPKMWYSWSCFTCPSCAHPWRSCTSLISYPASNFITEFNSPPTQASICSSIIGNVKI